MLFSIIIPTYNRADIIAKAIESVLNQAYKNFELIIVDDGSTDNTRDIVYRFRDDRISYYWKKNEERNIARNYGIKKAKGEYICFLDSDDILYCNHLNEAYLMASKLENPEVIHLNFEFKNKSITPSALNKRHIQNLNDALIKKNMLSFNSIFIRKDIIKKYQFLNSSNAIVSEDHYLWLRLAARYKIHLSLEVTNAVIVHDNRSLNSIDVDKLIIGFKEICSALSSDNIFMDYYGWKAQRYFSFKYIFIALQLVINNRKKESTKYLFKALNFFAPNFLSKRFLAVIKNLILR